MNYIITPTNDDLIHSRGPWKKHKYLKKIGKKYVYAKDKASEASTNAKYKMLYGEDPYAKTKANVSEYKSTIGYDSNRYKARRTKAFLKTMVSFGKEKARLNKARKASFGSALLTAGKRLVSDLLKKISK